MLKDSTKLDWVRSQGCADKLTLNTDEFSNPDENKPLKDDVLMLDVDGKRVCVYKGEYVETGGGLHFSVVDLEEFIQDNRSELKRQDKGTDGKITPVAFRLVRYWVDPGFFGNFKSWLGPALVALALGVISADIHTRLKGRSGSGSATPPQPTQQPTPTPTSVP